MLVNARPSRPSRPVLLLALTTGLALGGTDLAHAATSTPRPSASPSSASAGRAPAAPPAPSKYDGEGVLTSESSGSLSLRTDTGSDLTYALTSSTSYQAGPGRTLTRASLKVGDRVHVRATSSSTSSRRTAAQVDSHPARLDGTITSVTGTTFTLVDRDGFARTARTSSSTTYTDKGRKATSSALSTGDAVHAEGAVDSNGTTLDATAVDLDPVRPVPPAGGPGHGHAAGPGAGPKGGPAAGGGAPVPPTATAQPDPSGTPATSSSSAVKGS